MKAAGEAAEQPFWRSLPAYGNGLSHQHSRKRTGPAEQGEAAWYGRRIRAPKDRPAIRTQSTTKISFRAIVFSGGSFQSLPVDQSEKRLCEQRCFGLLDDMNNWAGPKYMIAEGDTYMKYPDDETFPQLMVNYVKLDRVPKFKDGWTPVVDALRAGDYFVTTGEVLFRNWSDRRRRRRIARIRRKRNGHFRPNSRNWCGAMEKGRP